MPEQELPRVDAAPRARPPTPCACPSPLATWASADLRLVGVRRPATAPRGTARPGSPSSRLLRGEQLAEAVGRVAELLVHRRAVDELQRLGEVAVALALALAGQFAGRLAERLQERVVHLAVGQLDRPRARPAGRRTSPAPPVTSQIASSSCSAVSSFVTACEKYLRVVLVRARSAGADSWYVREFMIVRDQVLQVELVRRRSPWPGRRAVRRCRRVRVAEVVHRVDDALAHQVEPDAVDDRLGEERVVRRRSASRPAPSRRSSPGGDVGVAARRGTRGFIVLPVRGCVTSPSRSTKTTSAPSASAVGFGADRPASGFGLHPGEPRGHAVVVVLRPALERVVVALRALHPHAEEQLGRRLGEALRVLGDAVVVGRRVGERVAAGGEQLAHDLVERRVLRRSARGATPGSRSCPSPGSSCGSTRSTSAHFSAQKSANSGASSSASISLSRLSASLSARNAFASSRRRQEAAQRRGTPGGRTRRRCTGPTAAISSASAWRRRACRRSSSPAGSARRSPSRGSRYVSRTDDQLFEVAAQDGDLAGPLELDQAVRRHVGDRRVAAAEDGQPGDVADRAVGERRDARRVAATWPGRSARGAPGSTSTFLTAGQRRRRRPCSPSASHAVIISPGTLVAPKRCAAFVRHAAERLQQHQAGVRVVLVGAAAELVAGELQEVGGRVEAAERELEAVLAARACRGRRRRCSRRRSAPRSRRGGS